MQANIITEIFLPVALGIIMLGMGLSLTLNDFKRLVQFPRATFVGLFCQLLLLPAIAFLLLHLIELPPALAVGVMLLSLCPGGATSNLLSNLARADVALSITLTALSSLITVFSIPFLINLSMEHFIGEGRYVELPVLKTMLQIIIITIIPVTIGMLIRWRNKNFAIKAEKPVKIASAIFIAIVLLGAILKERHNLAGWFLEVGVITFTLNIVILVLGYGIAKLSKLSHPQCSTVAIESGIQNGTLAIAIATSSMLLNNSQMSIPAAIYSLFMFATGGVAVYLFSRKFMFDRAFKN
jgi:BASS family bile acid:Na+ symporter